MPNKLKMLIKGYEDTSAKLELAISQSPCGDSQIIRRHDENLTDLFENIVNLELELDQRLTRISFFTDVLSKNCGVEDVLGSRLISFILKDARQLHNQACR